MAQEFYSAFGNDGIGTIRNDTNIASSDFDGINFIAINALEKRTREQDRRIAELEKQNGDLVELISGYRQQNIKSRIINSELRNKIAQIEQTIIQFSINQNKIELASKR